MSGTGCHGNSKGLSFSPMIVAGNAMVMALTSIISSGHVKHYRVIGQWSGIRSGITALCRSHHPSG